MESNFDILTMVSESKAYAEAELMMMEAATVEERKEVFYNNLFEEIKSTFVHEQQHVAQALASVSKGVTWKWFLCLIQP